MVNPEKRENHEKHKVAENVKSAENVKIMRKIDEREIAKKSRKTRKTLGNHTIRKVKFLSKISILTIPQHFHEFFTPIFFGQIFS